MTTGLILHFLNEIVQMSKFRFFVSRDKFSRIAQMFLKFVNVNHSQKIIFAGTLAGKNEK